MTGVLLHVVETAVPIDDSPDFRPIQFLVEKVDNPVPFLEDMRNRGLSQTAPIGRLASGLGIEAGLFEHGGWFPLVCELFQDASAEFPPIGIFEIESSRHCSHPVMRRGREPSW